MIHQAMGLVIACVAEYLYLLFECWQLPMILPFKQRQKATFQFFARLQRNVWELFRDHRR